MSNFNEFIIEDITVKKELLSTMPLNNKTNIKKYNEKINNIQEKYKIYKKSLLAYVVELNNNLLIEKTESNIEKLEEKIEILESGIRYFDPYMSVNEKCGFEGLKYNIKHFNDYNFESMNKIIDAYMKKFEIAGVKLTAEDFTTTVYSNEYMKAFIDNKNINGQDNYESLSPLFEKLYWKNPDLILQISDDFRVALKIYENKLNDYIEEKKRHFTEVYKFKNYNECLVTLKKAYERLYEEQKETIYDIVEYARNGEIEINNYKEDAKVRNDVLSELIIDYDSIKNTPQMDKVYENLFLLERNIQEYIDYNNSLPLIESFKKNYEEHKKMLEEKYGEKNGEDKDNKEKPKKEKKKKAKGNNELENQLSDLLDKIEENNNYIKKGKKGFKKFSSSQIEEFKEKSIVLAKELRIIRHKLRMIEVGVRIDLMFEKQPITIESMLQVLYRFDQMKRELIRQVYSPEKTIEEMVEYYHKFDSYANNPTHYIINNILMFEDSNIDNVLMNNYRLKGIRIREDNLRPENLEELLNKIKMLLRINTINKSNVTAEDIWFKLQAEKLIQKETPKEEEQN